MSDSNNKRFFSLAWRTTLAVSLATLIASASVYLFGKFTLERNYIQERLRIRKLYQQGYYTLIQNSRLNDLSISWLMPAFISPDLSNKEALTLISHLIENNWFKIELKSDIDSLYLLSRDNKIIGKWGETISNTNEYSDLIAQVIKREEPVNQVYCTHVCRHIYVSPFLHNGRFIGIFIFAIDLASTVIQMHEMTDTDIGILIKDVSITDKKLTYLDKLSSRVIALTGYKKNLPLLKALMTDPHVNKLNAGLIFEYDQKSFEISTIPFTEDNETAELIIIDDITDELADLSKATNLYAIAGLLSLLLSGGIILLLMLGPTRRIKLLANVLPLIAQKNYHSVLKLLPKAGKQSIYNDEFNLLNEAIYKLIATLKELDAEVEKRTKRLSEKTIELQKEKNFVSNILNTAQVIIMTLDETGKIISLNKYGEKLIRLDSYTSEDIKFTDLISDTHDLEKISTAITSIDHNKYHYHFECNIDSGSGSKLFVSWYFTHIAGPDHTSEILVVGLDLTERNQIESKLAWLADHDPLTNLYNRRRFEIELKRALSLADRYNQSGALIYFDIDQFKLVNDSSGHEVGDELLVRVSDKLKCITRGSDLVARVGGDEFVILAPHMSLQHASNLAEKICTEIATIEITADNSVHRASISAGLLLFPIPGYSEQDIMASVDLAMYKAKQQNKGSWCLVTIDDVSREEVRSRVSWKFNLQKGLQQNKFLLYFQPIQSISDNSIKHYECLLRMINDEGRVVSPNSFLHFAEQTGLMISIDKRALELAIKTQAEFINNKLDIILSVNLSGEMISNPEIINIVTGLFKEYNVPASRFIFEITESQAVTNLFAAQSFMRKIHEIGGKFALDDFGVGFSSMSHLKQLPIQYLKIDGGFVKNLDVDKEDKLFIQAINSVGHGMGLKTVAEFVENEQIYAVLCDIGVDYAQGYAIGRPVTISEIYKTYSGGFESRQM